MIARGRVSFAAVACWPGCQYCRSILFSFLVGFLECSQAMQATRCRREQNVRSRSRVGSGTGYSIWFWEFRRLCRKTCGGIVDLIQNKISTVWFRLYVFTYDVCFGLPRIMLRQFIRHKLSYRSLMLYCCIWMHVLYSTSHRIASLTHVVKNDKTLWVSWTGLNWTGSLFQR